MNLQSNKVAIVTGASSGIGAATVRALLADGFVVYAGARRVERMMALAEAGAVVRELDVTEDASITAFVAGVVAERGRIDLLVNNAGYGSYGALEDVPLEEARRQFEVNVFGLARITQLVLPVMRAKQSGRIVNVSSIGGKMHEPLGAWYHATKFAVEGLSDCLRMEVASFGIDVVVIEPGGIKTEWGAIARESMLRFSGATAYAEEARINLLNGAPDMPGLSDPAVIGSAIARAARVRRPKTRYALGMGAMPILTLRRVLSDRSFDGILRLLARRASRT